MFCWLIYVWAQVRGHAGGRVGRRVKYHTDPMGLRDESDMHLAGLTGAPSNRWPELGAGAYSIPHAASYVAMIYSRYMQPW